MATSHISFRGILFIGLMLTSDGPKVLEYNVRFGDPETQAILVRLESNLIDVFYGIADELLGEVEVKWSNEPSACVVLAARGYPGKPETGMPIEGLDRAVRYRRRPRLRDVGSGADLHHHVPARRHHTRQTVG